MEIVDIRSDDMKVNVYGDFAVLTGTQQACTRKCGEEELSAGAFTDVFAKRRGRLLLVLAYNVELPPASSKSTEQ